MERWGFLKNLVADVFSSMADRGGQCARRINLLVRCCFFVHLINCTWNRRCPDVKFLYINLVVLIKWAKNLIPCKQLLLSFLHLLSGIKCFGWNKNKWYCFVAVQPDAPAPPRVRAGHRHGRRQVSLRPGWQLHCSVGGEGQPRLPTRFVLGN